MQNYNVLTDVKTGARIYDKGEKKPTTVATIVWPYPLFVKVVVSFFMLIVFLDSDKRYLFSPSF